MTLRTSGAVLRHVRAVCATEGNACLTDEQLLQRFVASREEPAFRALLLRHGPLVWGICRRLLHDGDVAEDAFQATFVTLARKAEAIRKQASLGSWLPPQDELNAEAIDAAWAALAETDAEKAVAAIRTLAGFSNSASVLAERTQPTVPADPALLTRLLADLDDGDFAKREKAEERLAQIGDLAVPALEKVLAGNPGLESRKRIEHILDAIVTEEQPRPEVLQALRAIEVLERIGSPAARQALEKLAGGEGAARQTKAARTALARLSATASVRAD